MNKYIYVLGAFAVGLSMGGLPALAESGSSDGRGDVSVSAAVQAQETDISADVSARDDSEDERAAEGRPEVSDDQDDTAAGEDGAEIEIELEIELEDEDDTAASLQDLERKIEERRGELDDEEASTTPKFRNAMKNANEVRLAVHALLASRELLGGIGSQVSEIAKRMNDSVATTTRAEVKIQSRGFLARVFFGGDREAAEILDKETERNQESIAALTRLLEEGGLSAGIRTALSAQITALEEAQARLRALAEREQKLWGLFSWRF